MADRTQAQRIATALWILLTGLAMLCLHSIFHALPPTLAGRAIVLPYPAYGIVVGGFGGLALVIAGLGVLRVVKVTREIAHSPEICRRRANMLGFALLGCGALTLALALGFDAVFARLGAPYSPGRLIVVSAWALVDVTLRLMVMAGIVVSIGCWRRIASSFGLPECRGLVRVLAVAAAVVVACHLALSIGWYAVVISEYTGDQSLEILPRIEMMLILNRVGDGIAAIPIAGACALFYKRIRELRRPLRGFCPECDYKLQPVISGCPECGWGRSGDQP